MLNAAILNKIYIISSITAELNKLLSLKISPCSGMGKRRTQLGTVFVINVPCVKRLVISIAALFSIFVQTIFLHTIYYILYTVYYYFYILYWVYSFFNINNS